MKKHTVLILVFVAGLASLGYVVSKEYLHQTNNTASNDTTVSSTAPDNTNFYTTEPVQTTVTYLTTVSDIPVMTDNAMPFDTAPTDPASTVSTVTEPIMDAEPVGFTIPQDNAAQQDASELQFGTVADYWHAATPEERTRDILIAKAGYEKKRNTYASAYKELTPNMGKEAHMNVLQPEKLHALAQYSPIASIFEDHSEEIRINPYLLLNKLTNPEFTGNGQRILQKHELVGTARNARVFTDPATLIQTALCEQFGPAMYNIGYSAKDDLYYTYLVSADKNIVTTALYFRFNASNVLTGIGADCGIYTGGELKALKGGSAERLDALNTDTDDVLPVYLGTEQNTTDSLMNFMTALIGSADQEGKLIIGGRIIAEERCRIDYVSPTDKGAKGLFYNVWTTVA